MELKDAEENNKNEASHQTLFDLAQFSSSINTQCTVNSGGLMDPDIQR